MTRHEAYRHMQTINRGDYEMGDIPQALYESTELALAVDWDEQRDRRVARARQIHEERRAERRLRDAVLVVECRQCRNYLDIPALSFDPVRGHICAICAREAVWV